ncbi:MAG: YfhO family protein [Anaerolineae bacterium]|nr:YfhO family protein [Anaerolineae bacterium]
MINRILNRWPLVIMFLALVAIFYRLLLGEVFFWGLPSLQFYPWRELSFDMLRNGQLPLWNPYNGAGAPLLANYQSQFFYPFSWIGLVLPLGFAMSVTVVLHLFIAAAGMWAFTGRLSLPTLGRGVSALAFGLTSYLVARLGTYPMIEAAAWMPWILWAVLALLEDRRLRDIGWLAVLVALQLLAGHAQTSWYSLLLAGFFTLFWIGRNRPADWWKRLAMVAGAVALGIGIAAIQLLPTAELLQTSQRSGGVDFDFAMNFSYSPVRTLNFLSPNVFGNPGDGSYVTEGAFFEDAVYIGLLPLVAALAAIVSWVLRRLRREDDTPPQLWSVPFWIVIAGAAFVFALGSNTGIYPFLYRNVPTFDLFQAPVRWHLWTVFTLSILAGVGVTAAWGRGHWLFFGTRLAIAGCVGAVILALVVVPSVIPAETLNTEGVQVLVRAVSYTAVVGAIMGALTLLQPDQGTQRYGWWSFGVVMLVAVDLIYAAQGLNPTIPSEFYRRLSVVEQDSGRGYWPEGPDKAEYYVKFDVYLQFADYRVAVEEWEAYRDANLPNMNLLERRYLLNNFDPLRVGHFDAYINLIEADEPWQKNLLQAADIDGIYLKSGDKQSTEFEIARAWFVGSACWQEDEAGIIDAISNTDWQPLTQVQLLGEGDCAPVVNADVGTVLNIEEQCNSLAIDVENNADGYLVVADTFYPGWIATVDGEPAQIEQANLAFRAVEVPAGARQVRFEYHPAWLLPGMLVSVVSLLLLILLLRIKNPNA